MGICLTSSKALLRRLILGLSVLAFAGGLSGSTFGQYHHAVLIDINGDINPVTAGFLDGAVDKAEEDGAELIIVRLDTSGGLLSSTRDMVTKLLRDNIPSVVYVAPGGAHAASAGTFITAAANIAVMAPGTNIGAASPVGTGGEELPETIKSKIMEDVAALMREIASTRGRNVEKLEATVLHAIAYSSQEADNLNIVDLIAIDLDELLQKLDGMIVETQDGSRILRTDGIEVLSLNMSFVERLLMVLSEPNISFILLSTGGLGIIVELFNPGLVVPGVVGVICLLLAFLVLGNLPVNWAGVAFILLAMALLFLEVQVAGFGILGGVAIISFVIGGLLLFDRFGAPSPTAPSVSVSLWVLLPTVGLLLSGGGWFVATMVRSRQIVSDPIPETVIGQIGIVTYDLLPRGTVQLTSELWSAVGDCDEVIKAGESVEVIGLEGLTLRVVKARE